MEDKLFAMWLRGVQRGLHDAGKEAPSPELWAQIEQMTDLMINHSATG